MSKMFISRNVLNGYTRQSVNCPYCETQFTIRIRNKHRKQKIVSTKCPKCNKYITYGDIYNFDTGSKLNKRLENYNQDTYDEYQWNHNYDKL